ncbi:MAG: polysaccharide deacetylase family protein [Bacteroides sp.]|nr:polysaccharide deacetylase family protein [Prevotella sp.]MCM1408746.1 polysaccharide deacetylase family protein [Treponema brennaborense]MCM1470661.1 polysaccharide deacetylase family protein [Bacteroides sp.]
MKHSAKIKCRLFLMCAAAGFFDMFFAAHRLNAQVSFSDLDLNSENRLLFSAEHSEGADESYKSLFVYDLNQPPHQNIPGAKKPNPKLITCYPQSMEILHGGTVLQIRNRYGTAHYYTDEKQLRWVERPSELAVHEERFIPLEDRRLNRLSVSPDGKWICSVRKKTAASGDLILTEAATGSVYILSPDIEYSFDTVPVLWAPDSSVVTYEKNGILYFLDVRGKSPVTEIPDFYRQIGQGTIRCLFWASPKLLIYISNEIVYAIPANELYTRALYSELVGAGRIIGRLPYSFDGTADRFWTNENGSAVVLAQSGRTLWYLETGSMDFGSASALFSYPFVNIPGTAVNFSVFWTPAAEESGKKNNEKQIPYIWLELSGSGGTRSYAYKLAEDTSRGNRYFSALPLPPSVSKPLISPDKKQLAFAGEKALYVYDLRSWKQNAVFSNERPVSFTWASPAVMYVGGEETIREWNVSSGVHSVLLLSSAPRYAWDNANGKIAAGNASGYYLYDETRNVWNASNRPITRKQSLSNDSYRVFIGASPNVLYKNALYARSLSAVSSNIPLFPDTALHNTLRRPRIALVFDALDCADGVTAVLASLRKYRLRATFFINGEFLRRFPSAAKEIASAGHECASLFYAAFPLDSENYKIDETFIRRGLARNEDDFFALTGTELALLWHTPYYYYNDMIARAGEQSGYRYIHGNLLPGDTVTLEAAACNDGVYVSAAAMIDNLAAALHDGAVIPVSIGVSGGIRRDYLYDKLDLLISAAKDAGYDIVCVSDLHKQR